MVTFDVENASVEELLRYLGHTTGQAWPELLKKEARLYAVSLAFQSHPIGDKPEGKLMGEAAVRRDIAEVYADAPAVYLVLRQKDQAMAGAFYRAMLQRDYRAAREILRTSQTRWANVPIEAFAKSKHKESRGRRGRVNRHVPAQIVTNFRAKDKYLREKLRMVGFGKGGWATCAMQLTGNTRGMPQWVTRHKGDAPGDVQNRSTHATNPHIIMTNKVTYADRVCPPSEQVRALRYSEGRLREQVRRVLNSLR